MRKATQTVVGLVSLGVLAGSWSIGQATETGLVVSAPTPSESLSSAPTTSSTPIPSQSLPSTPSASSTPLPNKTPQSKTVTKTSDAISYVAHLGQGKMQISVTKSGGSITDITIVNGGTEGGEYSGVPNILAKAALQAQGLNFGNVGGATHTTDAFKKALENTLAKF